MIEKNNRKFFFKDKMFIHIAIFSLLFTVFLSIVSESPFSFWRAVFLFFATFVAISVVYSLSFLRRFFSFQSREGKEFLDNAVQNTKSFKDILPESPKSTKLAQLLALGSAGKYTDKEIIVEAKKHGISSFRVQLGLSFQANPVGATIMFLILVLGAIFVIGTLIGEIFY